MKRLIAVILIAALSLAAGCATKPTPTFPDQNTVPSDD